MTTGFCEKPVASVEFAPELVASFVDRGDDRSGGGSQAEKDRLRQLKAGLDGFGDGVSDAHIVKAQGLLAVPSPGEDGQIRPPLSD